MKYLKSLLTTIAAFVGVGLIGWVASEYAFVALAVAVFFIAWLVIHFEVFD